VKHSKIKGIPKLDDANDAGKTTYFYHLLIFTDFFTDIIVLNLSLFVMLIFAFFDTF